MQIPGYRIERMIGKGGMASVYLARQVSLDRPVVLKLMDISTTADNTSHIQRFLSEGRIVAALNHPNIITIYDIGISDENLLYISMEYIRGGDLKARIGIPMDPAEALDIITKIASGMKLAHENEVIHRDIKPANILFRDDVTPVLSDFGIAKQIDKDLDLTSTGVFIGSPNYVSPEQASGEQIDGRTDIYSLGCIFYEMLTGEKPYKAETVFEVVMKHKSAPIPELPEDLSRYQKLLEKMLAKKRDDRFHDAGELIQFIKQLRAEQKPLAGVLDLNLSATAENTGKKSPAKFRILMVLLFISAVFFLSVQYLDIRLKSDKVNLSKIPVSSVLTEKLEDTSDSVPPVTEPVSPDVVNALRWLGHQSLEEYRLTYPPKDNAYYYFSRLLAINPDDVLARQGLLEISDRYAVLAERSLAANDYAKTSAYIDLGLKINPSNKTLLSIKEINDSSKATTVMDRIKALFR